VRFSFVFYLYSSLLLWKRKGALALAAHQSSILRLGSDMSVWRLWQFRLHWQKSRPSRNRTAST